jgi:protease IV
VSFVFLRLLRNLALVLAWPVLASIRALRPDRPTWIEVVLRGRWPEVATPRPFWDPRPAHPSIGAVRRALVRVQDDPSIEGVLFEIDGLQAGWASCESLREIIGALRDRGKRTVAYLPSGGGTREYFVASACDEVHMPPAATLFLLGMAREVPYLQETLERAGVKVEILAAGDHKSAGDMVSRRDMSPADREQTEALFETVWRELVGGIAEGRHLAPEVVRAAIDAAPLRPAAAVERGLVDSVSYDDELRHKLLAERPEGAVRFVPLSRDGKERALKVVWKPLRAPPVIAVLEVSGPIVSRGTGSLTGRVAAADQFVKAARAAQRSARVCAVVVHVESGGGSALASDEMHHALTRLREKHPVCCSFGNVAASGGYYLAVATERIFARPTTVTGSIGVVTGKLDLSGLLGNLHVGRGVVTRGAHATMLSPSKPLTESERAALGGEIAATYELFLERVATGRGRSRDEILRIAGGRVWSGTDAHREGLVDDLGGLPAALEWARARAGHAGQDAEVRVVRVHPAARVPPLPLPAAAGRVVELAALATSSRMLLLSTLDLEASGWD